MVLLLRRWGHNELRNGITHAGTPRALSRRHRRADARGIAGHVRAEHRVRSGEVVALRKTAAVAQSKEAATAGTASCAAIGSRTRYHLIMMSGFLGVLLNDWSSRGRGKTLMNQPSSFLRLRLRPRFLIIMILNYLFSFVVNFLKLDIGGHQQHTHFATRSFAARRC